MESDFYTLYENQDRLSLQVGHNSVAGWIITVQDKKGVPLGQEGKVVVYAESRDRKLAFAEAYVTLAEYLLDERGGY